MKKTITLLLTLLSCHLVVAQKIKTVESVYEDYRNAIGGEEKIKTISNIMEYSKSYGTSYFKFNN